MSELDTAQRHLTEALRRLEAALARRLAAAPAGAATDPEELARLTSERDELAHEVSVLRSECDRLSAALGETQHTNQSLREVTHQVAQRLDHSIGELDRLLEG